MSEEPIHTLAFDTKSYDAMDCSAYRAMTVTGCEAPSAASPFEAMSMEVVCPHAVFAVIVSDAVPAVPPEGSGMGIAYGPGCPVPFVRSVGKCARCHR